MTAARRSARPVGNPWLGIVPATLFVVLFFAVPTLATLAQSFAPSGSTAPSLANYAAFFATARLVDAATRSLLLGFGTVAIATLLAWPLAYFLAFLVPERWRFVALLAVIAPFWTSFLIRAFSWQLVLSDAGLIAHALGLVAGEPVALGILYSFTASLFGLALFGTMLMTLTLFSTMVAIDRNLVEASAALGASPLVTFGEVILPLALPGWISGAVLTFIVAVGDYAVPALLGGGFKPVLAQVMISTIKGTYDISMAATMAVVLAGIVLLATLPLAFVPTRPAGRRS